VQSAHLNAMNIIRYRAALKANVYATLAVAVQGGVIEVASNQPLPEALQMVNYIKAKF